MTQTMRTARFMALAAVTAVFAACNNAAESEAETTGAQEVTEVAEAMAFPVTSTSGHINWVGYKTFVDWGHNGTIQVKEGEFRVKDGELAGGSFVIDMNSIHAVDLAEDQEKYDMLLGHLKSADFFETETYPTAKFEITEITPNTGGETSHRVKGNLTMKDTTNNIAFDANITVSDDMVVFQTPEFSIDRTKWNVMFRSSGIEGVAKDDLIDDHMKLSVDLTAQK